MKKKLTWEKTGWFCESDSARYETCLSNGDTVAIEKCSYSKLWHTVLWTKANGEQRFESRGDTSEFKTKRDLQLMIQEVEDANLYPAPKNSVSASQLSTLRMAAGNEGKYSKVIHKGIVKEWVGIGWINLERPTQTEIDNLPIVI